MVDIDIIDLNSMIIGFIAIIISILFYKKKLEFLKYLPGFIGIILVFVANSFDDYIFYHRNFFDMLENIGILSGAILLFIAALYELKKENEVNNNHEVVSKE
ncbi:MAG: hypothetical protein ACFFAO_18335 [Candidatus Hermodarchaeota archaeon]